MSQNLLLAEKILKEAYLPGFANQVNTEASPLLTKIKKVKATGHKIVLPAPIGLSGGFGFGAEGEATPKSGAVRMERLESTTKDMYVEVVISEKAMKLGGSAGSMVNLYDAEMNGAYEAAKFNLGRALFGNGTGVLANISALTAAGNTLTVDDCKRLAIGMRIDIYETGGTEPVTGDGGVRIKDIDYENKQILVDGPADAYNAGFITVQNSYNKEITGLYSIFDDNITKLYGLEKANNNFLRPIVVDSKGDIDDSIITKALRDAKNKKGSKIDTLLCGDKAFDAYVAYLRVNNIRVEERTHEIQGGFKAIKFVFGNTEVDVINDSFVADNEMWGIESDAFEFHQTDWSFAELQSGGIFNLMERQSAYRALLANFGELMCKRPGGCVRIANCA